MNAQATPESLVESSISEQKNTYTKPELQLVGQWSTITGSIGICNPLEDPSCL